MKLSCIINIFEMISTTLRKTVNASEQIMELSSVYQDIAVKFYEQDAPSPSTSHSTQGTQTPIISHDVEEDNHDIEVAHMGNDPYFDWTKEHPLENITGALDSPVFHTTPLMNSLYSVTMMPPKSSNQE
ncbi:hypothetical protein Tco_0278462 [Tanacetum coccineum]